MRLTTSLVQHHQQLSVGPNVIADRNRIFLASIPGLMDRDASKKALDGDRRALSSSRSLDAD
jgi:hypothetical protein